MHLKDEKQIKKLSVLKCHNFHVALKANFKSVEFSERAEILLLTGENVALKLNR